MKQFVVVIPNVLITVHKIPFFSYKLEILYGTTQFYANKSPIKSPKIIRISSILKKSPVLYI